MHCPECSEADEATVRSNLSLHFVPAATVKVVSRRYRTLLSYCLSRIPPNGAPLRFPTEIRLRRRGDLPGIVGLTTFSLEGYAPRGFGVSNQGRHTITFYTDLLNRLSRRAVVAIMAHELAHAWLNEHIRPEASKVREEDADMLAEMWGFGPELEALAAETEPLDSG
jgi:hypothetical protein